MLPTPEKRWPEMDSQERLAYVQSAPMHFTSARAAGDFIGASKNSILSIANRKDVYFGRRGIYARKAPAEKPPQKPKERFNAFVRAKTPAKAEKRASEVPMWGASGKDKVSIEEAAAARIEMSPAWAPLEAREPLELWQLGSCQCHWPVYRSGEPAMFCAADTDEDEVYCGTHRKIAGGRRKDGKDGTLMPGDRAERRARMLT